MSLNVTNILFSLVQLYILDRLDLTTNQVEDIFTMSRVRKHLTFLKLSSLLDTLKQFREENGLRLVYTFLLIYNR